MFTVHCSLNKIGEVLSAYSLTPNQIRLLEELQRQEYLTDAIRVTTQNNIEVVEV